MRPLTLIRRSHGKASTATRRGMRIVTEGGRYARAALVGAAATGCCDLRPRAVDPLLGEPEDLGRDEDRLVVLLDPDRLPRYLAGEEVRGPPEPIGDLDPCVAEHREHGPDRPIGRRGHSLRDQHGLQGPFDGLMGEHAEVIYHDAMSRHPCEGEARPRPPEQFAGFLGGPPGTAHGPADLGYRTRNHTARDSRFRYIIVGHAWSPAPPNLFLPRPRDSVDSP